MVLYHLSKTPAFPGSRQGLLIPDLVPPLNSQTTNLLNFISITSWQVSTLLLFYWRPSLMRGPPPAAPRIFKLLMTNQPSASVNASSHSKNDLQVFFSKIDLITLSFHLQRNSANFIKLSLMIYKNHIYNFSVYLMIRAFTKPHTSKQEITRMGIPQGSFNFFQ